MTAHGDAFDTSAERVDETPDREHVGMEHAIEQAAQVMWEAAKVDFGGVVERDCHVLARALAAAGLLAPGPLTEEWGSANGFDLTHGADEPVLIYEDHEESSARADAGERGQVRRRLVTDWEPVDRAEGDGSTS